MSGGKAAFAFRLALLGSGNAPERFRQGFGIQPRLHTFDSQAWESLVRVLVISRTAQLEGAAPTLSNENARGKC
jgi:hypothetical protein